MSRLNKTLVAAAITGILAVPAAHAFDEGAFYSSNGKGTITISGQKCKNLKYKKLNATLFISNGFEGAFEGGFEGNFFTGGMNTHTYNFNMNTFGSSIDGEGPAVASNQGRTFNMDTSFDGYNDIQSVMQQYIFGGLIGQDSGDGCKAPQTWNFTSLYFKRYETKISNNGKRAKLRLDSEGNYNDDDNKTRKAQFKTKVTMDLQNLIF